MWIKAFEIFRNIIERILVQENTLQINEINKKNDYISLVVNILWIIEDNGKEESREGIVCLPDCMIMLCKWVIEVVTRVFRFIFQTLLVQWDLDFRMRIEYTAVQKTINRRIFRNMPTCLNLIYHKYCNRSSPNLQFCFHFDLIKTCTMCVFLKW